MFVIDGALRNSQWLAVLTHDELLAELKAQAAAKRFKLKDLAAHLGIAPARINEMLGENRKIQPREMPLLAEWLGMSDSSESKIPEGAIPVVAVPVIGEIAAGNWKEAVKRSTLSIPAPHPSMPPQAFALEVSGDSMDLLVDDGAMIIVDPGDRQFFHKRYYAVQNGEGETTFKQYLGDPARLVPCSSNPAHNEIILGDEPITIIGRIIWRSSRM